MNQNEIVQAAQAWAKENDKRSAIVILTEKGAQYAATVNGSAMSLMYCISSLCKQVPNFEEIVKLTIETGGAERLKRIRNEKRHQEYN